MSSDIHVALSYQDGLPPELIEEFFELVSVEGAKVVSKARGPEFFAALEWAVPTVVIAYLSKPYFEAFLSEAGRDHYQLLKSAISKVFSRTKLASQDSKQDRSQNFSIVVKLEGGETLKFVFSDFFDENELTTALDQTKTLMQEHYRNSPDDVISKAVGTVSPPSRSVYMEFDIDESKWTLIDPMSEARKVYDAQSKHKNSRL
ncbi:MAG: hypothetical protein AAGG55_13265 [Pseudomonadota bacterium]